MTVQSLSTISPDFDYLVAQFQQQLATQSAWTDQLTTSTGQFIIELISAVGEYDQYALERVFQEMFPETARLDSSIFGAMKMLGTRLARNTPASVTLPLTNGQSTLLRTGNLTASLTIPAFTQFSTSLGNVYCNYPIVFAVGEAGGHQVDQANPLNRTAVILYQGTVNNVVFSSTGEEFVSILSAETNFIVADADVLVQVNGTTIPRQTKGLWYNINNIPGWQDITTSNGQLHVLFGSRIYGTMPPANALISLTYVTTSGASGNGTFSSTTVSCAAYPEISTTANVFSGAASSVSLSGGANFRVASDYKILGPQLFASDQGNKAVIPQDYTAILKAYPDIIDSLLVGQSGIDPTDARYANIARIVTYPKLGPTNIGINNPFTNSGPFTNLVNYLQEKSMWSMNFYRDEIITGSIPNQIGTATEPYPIVVDIQANIFCSQNANLVNVRDNYVVPSLTGTSAITGAHGLLDQLDDTDDVADIRYAQNSVISRNVYRSDIIGAIQRSNPTIDYVELLVPAEDIICEVTTPDSITATSFAGGPIATLGLVASGTGYTNNTYANVPLSVISGSVGFGATANITVASGLINTLGTITGGSLYTSGTYLNVPLTIYSGTSGTGATANIVTGGGHILTLGSITPGYLYNNGTYLNIPLTVTSGTVGSGATANITISGSAIISVTLINAGSGYDATSVLSASSIYIGAGDGTFVVPVATVSNGKVYSVTMVNRGSGYDLSSVLTCSSASIGGTGSGFYVPVTTIANNGVESVTIVNPGIGYSSTSVLSSTFIGSGSGFSVPVSTVSGALVGPGQKYYAITTVTNDSPLMESMPSPIAAVDYATVGSTEVALSWEPAVQFSWTNPTFGQNYKGYYVYGGNSPTNLIRINSGLILPTNVTPNSSTINGILSSLGSITGGSGYVNGTYYDVPLITISGTIGVGALANIVITSNAISSVTLTNGGAGYDSSSVLSAIAESIGGAGAGFNVAVSSVYSFPFLDSGQYVSATSGTIVTVGTIVPGSGYASGGTNTFYNVPLVVTSGAIGYDATANITVTTGAVSAVVITNGGIEYDNTSILTTANTNLGGTGSGFSCSMSAGTFGIPAPTQDTSGKHIVVLPGVGAINVGTITGGTGYDFGGTATYTNVPLYHLGAGLLLDATVAAGSVTGVTVANSGNGYPVGTFYNIPLVISGNYGTGATVDLTVANGIIESVGPSITGGTGYICRNYSSVPLLVSTGTVGANATANITVAGRVITGLTSMISGLGYLSGTYLNVPLTNISGFPGSGATANIIITGGAVSSVTLVNGGFNYDTTSVLGIDDSSVGSGGGSGFSISVASIKGGIMLDFGSPSWTGGTGYSDGVYLCTAVATSPAGNIPSVPATVYVTVTAHDVFGVTIFAGGKGYNTGDTFTVSGLVPWGATQVAPTFNVGTVSGPVAACTIVTPGLNYDTTSILTANNSNLGAAGSGFLIPVSSISTGVVSATVSNGGQGYNSGTYTNIPIVDIGQGQGALATIQVFSGSVGSVDITSYGNNQYASGTILTTPNTNLGGSGSGFQFDISYISSSWNAPSKISMNYTTRTSSPTLV